MKEAFSPTDGLGETAAIRPLVAVRGEKRPRDAEGAEVCCCSFSRMLENMQLALWLVACICILTLLVRVFKPQYVIVCSENFHIPCHRIWMQLWHVQMNLLTISEWYFFYTVTEGTLHEVSSSGTLCFSGLPLSRFDELPLSCCFVIREKMRAHLQHVHHKRWLLQLCIPWT